MSFCPKCGKEYSDKLPSCPFCAANNESVETVNMQPQVEQPNLNGGEDAFFGEIQPGLQPNDNKPGLSKGAIAGIIVGVVVIIAAIVVAIFCFAGNNGDSQTSPTASSEDLTMPSGYEDVITNITDEDGNVITEATDPYGNTITREVDDDGNVITTYIGPDGDVETVVTDLSGNIISNGIIAKSDGSSVNASSENNASKNNSSANSNSKSNSSDGGSNSSSSNSGGNTGSAASDGSITINGKKYKAGDTVTFSATAEGISEAVAGYQFHIDYDENLLELDESSVKSIDSSAMINASSPGIIYINAISITSGFNFSMPANLVECKFKVKDSNTKSCDISVVMEEVYTGTGSQELVDVTNDVEVNSSVN